MPTMKPGKPLAVIAVVTLVSTIVLQLGTAAEPVPATKAVTAVAITPWTGSFSKTDDQQLKALLTPLQYDVTQNEGTERAFNNEYWDNHEEGIYVDIVSGEPLFSSTDKFKSGTGWPSFTRPVSDAALSVHTDSRFFMKRTELKSSMAGSHLGHLFDDGPEPTGQRYCINSASLRFVPKAQMDAQGYGDYLSLFED
jgi:peptide methionine sulfoxide reductase msrA/msrB